LCNCRKNKMQQLTTYPFLLIQINQLCHCKAMSKQPWWRRALQEKRNNFVSKKIENEKQQHNHPRATVAKQKATINNLKSNNKWLEAATNDLCPTLPWCHMPWVCQSSLVMPQWVNSGVTSIEMMTSKDEWLWNFINGNGATSKPTMSDTRASNIEWWEERKLEKSWKQKKPINIQTTTSNIWSMSNALRKKPLGLQQAIKKENKTTIKFLQGTNAVCNSSMQYGCESRKKKKSMQASYW